MSAAFRPRRSYSLKLGITVSASTSLGLSLEVARDPRGDGREVHLDLGDRLLSGFEALPDSPDHHEEPVKVEAVEREVAGEIDGCEPEGDGGVVGGEEHDRVATGPGGRVAVDGGQDVAEGKEGLISAIDEAAGEEAEEQEEAVVKLGASTRHVKLVHEPVDVEEGRGELPQDEDAAIVVDKGALRECQ